MSHVFHRHCHQCLPEVSSGKGVYLFDKQGKSYLDACGGAAVSNLGHNHPRVKQAMLQQLDAIPYAHSGFFTSQCSEQLADLLSDIAPSSLNHTYFVSGGSEAVESALKLARQYFVEKGQPQRRHFIARKQSYHGNTMGALSVGGNQWRREPFSPMLHDSHFVSACYPYREQGADESEQQYSQRLANELERKIIELGPESVMAFVAEPIVGATAGVLVSTRGYFKAIKQVCEKYGVLLILDEVMCGVGRSGRFFAFEYEDIVPDIVTMAKGLAAGYQPVGAVMVSDEIYDSIAQGSGYFQHGHTFMAHPMACAAALATVQTILDEALLDSVEQRGAFLEALLQQRLGMLDCVGDIRGRGLFWGVELVADKSSKQSLPAELNVAQAVKAKAMELGLMCYPMAGTIDGKNGHHILLAPPFIISEEEIHELVERLENTLIECQKQWQKQGEQSAQTHRHHRCA